MTTDMTAPLTEEEKVWVFRTATHAFDKRYIDRIKVGMTDREIAETLEDIFGLEGGYGCEGKPHVKYQGSGLKIWGSWAYLNEHDAPLFAGTSTIATARRIYGIADPNDRQMALF